MSSSTATPVRWCRADALSVVARCLLGAVFLYMGLTKALHPLEFLKLVRQYDVLSHPLALNLVAATLPWFEMFCGLLLMLGVAVRGTSVMLVTMLVPFTVVVFQRALVLQHSGGLPFCAIEFDCGCGAGAVPVCRKLAENLLLLALSLVVVFRRNTRLGLRPRLV